MSEWQPMETAPTDKPVLVTLPDGVVTVAIGRPSWSDGVEWSDRLSAQSAYDSVEFDTINPVAWMPLPAPLQF
jgi:Mg-chelatase subunit ChlD